MGKQITQIPIKHPKKRAFLAAFSKTGNVGISAQAAKVNRCMHSIWMRDDPQYAAAFEDAKEEAADILEAEAVRRAVAGTRRKKFARNGDPVIDPATGEQYEELEYSDTLLIFLLKGVRPQKFRESINVVQATGVNVQQVGQDVAAMCGTIPPPAEAMQLAAKPPTTIESPQTPPGPNGHANGNGNGHANGNGHTGELL